MGRVRLRRRANRGKLWHPTAKVTVYRSQSGGKHGINACVSLGTRNVEIRRKKPIDDPLKIHSSSDFAFATACAVGRNPRIAISRAMAKLAKDIRRRPGALQGYRR